MEAPNNIMNLPMFLFGDFEMFNLISKIRIDLHQLWSPNLFNCFGKNLTLPNSYEMQLGTSWTNMEAQEYFCFVIFNICMEVEIWVEVCLHVCFIYFQQFKWMLWCKSTVQKVENLFIFSGTKLGLLHLCFSVSD